MPVSNNAMHHDRRSTVFSVNNIAVELFFTALHVMQTRYGEENSVCLSVRLSVRPSHAWIVTKR